MSNNSNTLTLANSTGAVNTAANNSTYYVGAGGGGGSSGTLIGSTGTIQTGTYTTDQTNYNGYLTIPSYPQYYSHSYPIVSKYDVQLERVENGWILSKDGKRYIVTKAEEILQYLQQDTK